MAHALRKPREAQKEAPQPLRPAEDFSHEYIGKHIRVRLSNGETVEGLLLEASKYWFKIKPGPVGVIYVNKAWVATVEPKTP